LHYDHHIQSKNKNQKTLPFDGIIRPGSNLFPDSKLRQSTMPTIQPKHQLRQANDARHARIDAQRRFYI